LRKIFFCPQMHTDYHGGLPCGSGFIHRITRICTDGLPCGSFFSTDGHGLTRMGFLTELFLSTDFHACLTARQGFPRRASLWKFFCPRISTDLHGGLPDGSILFLLKPPSGGWGAKKFIFNTISRDSGFLAEVFLSTD